jgi:hypothetical protein
MQSRLNIVLWLFVERFECYRPLSIAWPQCEVTSWTSSEPWSMVWCVAREPPTTYWFVAVSGEHCEPRDCVAVVEFRQDYK